MKIDDAEIAIAVRRDRKTIRECRFELEHEISAGEIYLFDRTVETTALPQQLRDLRWNATRHLVGKILQFCRGEAR
jgi:hypothetical protein